MGTVPAMIAAQLELRRQIFESFVRTGKPPSVPDTPELRGLAAARVVVLGNDGEILMAHPFAGHRNGARVEAEGRTWWGNCAWDAFGIRALLGLRRARITSNGITFELSGEQPPSEAVFHVSVPARHWWDDIGFT